MHPFKIIKIRDFPLGPTGKIDVNKLKKDYASIKIKSILEKHLKIKINKNTNIKLNSLKNLILEIMLHQHVCYLSFTT